MIDITSVVVGNKLELKKPHPCRGYIWTVLRTGIDFRLKCDTCGHEVVVVRKDLVKRIKKVIE